MTEAEPLPPAAQPEYLTQALTRCGLLRDGGRVSGVIVDSSKSTILSQIVRLRLSYEGASDDAPASLWSIHDIPQLLAARLNLPGDIFMIRRSSEGTFPAHLVAARKQQSRMSAFGGKADMQIAPRNICF